MKLGIYDRLLLPQILPERASIEIGIVCADIRKKIILTQEEIKKITLRTDPVNGGLSWDLKKEKPLQVQFTDMELEVITGAFKTKSDAKDLPTDERMIDLYRKVNSEEKKK
jgi:hypothetical protein